MGREKDIARILKDCLRIVDKLGDIDVEDIENELPEIEDLINKAKKIKKSREWKL